MNGDETHSGHLIATNPEGGWLSAFQLQPQKRKKSTLDSTSSDYFRKLGLLVQLGSMDALIGQAVETQRVQAQIKDTPKDYKSNRQKS